MKSRKRCGTKTISELNTKFLKLVLILSLLFPFNTYVKAQAKIEYSPDWEQLSSQNVLRANREVTERLATEYHQAQLANARKSYGTNRILQCVTYVKQYFGVSGTFGNGGRYLSLNSPPAIGTAVIFWRTHIAVVTGYDPLTQNLTISEANYDYQGHIRTRTLNALSPTIKGFHSF